MSKPPIPPLDNHQYVVLKSQGEKTSDLQNPQFDSGDDITKENLKVRRKYVVDLTKNNEYPIIWDGNDEPIPPNNTDYTDPITTDFGDQPNYLNNFRVNGNSHIALNEFLNSSNTKMLGNDFAIKKGNENSNAPNGTATYKDINENLSNSNVSKRVFRMLLDNNTYSPSEPLPTTENLIKLGVPNGVLGESPNNKWPKPNQQLLPLSIRDMKRMATLIMLQGSGEFIEPTANGVVNSGITVVPGKARLGVPVSVSRFSALEVHKSVTPGFNKTDSTNFINGDAKKLSYGSPYNPYVQFANFDSMPGSLPATTTAIALMATIGLFMKGIATMFKTTPQPTNPPTGNADMRKQWLGTSNPKVDTAINYLSNAAFDLVPTKHEFSACLNKGLSVFFEPMYKWSSVTEATLLGFFGVDSNTTKLLEYYNTILRNVVRGIATLGVNGYKSVEAVFDEDLASSDPGAALNPISYINKLNQSSFLRFLNMLLMIGDAVLSSDADDLPLSADEIEETITTRGLGSRAVINPAILQAKGRLSSGKHAIGNHSIKSLLMVPTNVLDAAEVYQKSNLDSVRSALNAHNIVVGANQIQNNKIQPEIVKEMEDYLEMDYMPFYIQDLRNNEILSFHAFIENISENITAEYTESDGYGRIGGVMTYKNTKRDMSIGFKMVSTSEDDFDQMWYKLNRLATMLYPQWTEGREVSYHNNKFIQPFSQVPSASPLVRLRVGDLWKSNYSRFNLARLFGIGNGIGEAGKFHLQNWQQEASDIQNARTQRNINQRRDAEFARRQTQSPPRYLPQDPVRIEAGSYGTSPGNRNNQQIRLDSVADATVIGERPIVSTIMEGSGRQRRRVSTTTVYYIVRVNRTGQTIATTTEHMIPMPYVANGTDATSGNNATRNNSQISEETSRFFNEGNPIVRSFENSSGKGIAGFIKSMKMGYDNVVWNTHQGNSRAPMFVQVDLEFAPIHDLQPGLDANGFMTAPIWNVGNIMGNFTDKEELRKSLETVLRARNSFGNR